MLTYLLTYWTLFDHLVDYNSTLLICSCPLCMFLFSINCFLTKLNVRCLGFSFNPVCILSLYPLWTSQRHRSFIAISIHAWGYLSTFSCSYLGHSYHLTPVTLASHSSVLAALANLQLKLKLVLAKMIVEPCHMSQATHFS